MIRLAFYVALVCLAVGIFAETITAERNYDYYGAPHD
jgi:hypothetical protein